MESITLLIFWVFCVVGVLAVLILGLRRIYEIAYGIVPATERQGCDPHLFARVFGDEESCQSDGLRRVGRLCNRIIWGAALWVLLLPVSVLLGTAFLSAVFPDLTSNLAFVSDWALVLIVVYFGLLIAVLEYSLNRLYVLVYQLVPEGERPRGWHEYYGWFSLIGGGVRNALFRWNGQHTHEDLDRVFVTCCATYWGAIFFCLFVPFIAVVVMMMGF